MTDDRVGGRGHPKFHTIGDIALQLDVSARSVHRWIAQGELIVHRIGDPSGSQRRTSRRFLPCIETMSSALL
jgi:hypothetical protein